MRDFGGVSAGSAAQATAGVINISGAGGKAGSAGVGGGGTSAGSSGSANAGGVSGIAGAAAASGTTHDAGGAAGRADAAGAGEGGHGNDAGARSGAGTGGVIGEGGARNEAGAAGDDADSGAPNDAAGASGAAGVSGAANEPNGLSWPIDCIPNDTCTGIGYPDTDEDGDAFDCGEPGYFGHQGTDIGITAEAQAAGTAVRAAADGVVLFAFDGKYDQCPNANEPDCQDPSNTPPGSTNGTTVCTPEGPYCGTGQGICYWCFAGGNVIVIRHEGIPGVFATRYDHLKTNSVLVAPGDTVTRGQKIAEAASAGASTAPHLHFEVWGTGFYELADPWAGPCGPNTGPSLWAHDPPWSG